ncbi:Metallo-hydrolase/oxidoreductase [Glonium stellatum]|uniref:Metallo-hydrolase/oxidoreductase n=1 Tax=Glonium stellatum TaxID=574774 RepID=A0A8E2F369_9PEZI|nr:Metallo-hydrolase/oxidoreductase [Glonium stellatum]
MKSLLLTLLAAARTAAACSHLSELNTTFAALPATAHGLALNAAGYAVQAFGGGAYMVTDGSYQNVFFVSTAGVILVDLPPTIGTNVLYAIGNVTTLPVTHLVYSHAHADHIGAAALVAGAGGSGSGSAVVEIVAHADTKELLQEVADPLRPLPTTTFEEQLTLRVGNQTLELRYEGENHARGNIFIYAPVQKLLVLIDVVFPGWVPFAQLAVSSNVPGWIAAHDKVLAYDFTYYVGGHLGRAGTRDDVVLQKQYVADLFENCKSAINLSATVDPVLGAAALIGEVESRNPGNKWADFRGYLAVVAEYCGNVTADKWVGRLGAADVWGYENAFMMVERLRLDYNVLGPFRNT